MSIADGQPTETAALAAQWECNHLDGRCDANIRLLLTGNESTSDARYC